MSDAAREFASYNWLTVKEVAAEIRAGDDFVRARIRRKVKGFQFKDVLRRGRDYLIKPEEVQRFIKENTVNNAA